MKLVQGKNELNRLYTEAWFASSEDTLAFLASEAGKDVDKKSVIVCPRSACKDVPVLVYSEGRWQVTIQSACFGSIAADHQPSTVYAVYDEPR